MARPRRVIRRFGERIQRHEVSLDALRTGKENVNFKIPLEYLECVAMELDRSGKTFSEYMRELIYERHHECIERMSLPVKLLVEEEYKRRMSEDEPRVCCA